MKKSLLFLLAVAILAAPLHAQPAAEPPAWTNTAGVTIRGEFIRLDGQAVVILKDGREVKIPFAKLNGDSIRQAEKLAAASPVRNPAGSGLAIPMPEHATVPAPGAWKKGLHTLFPRPGIDRLFLVDRGWVEGKLTGLDSSSVTLGIDNETLRFPRNAVSLIGLSDWLSPASAPQDRLVRLRVTLAGTAECATLLFTGGAIIHSVDAAPRWTLGNHEATQAKTDITGISFDKGSNQSQSELVTDVTLLLPASGPLKCEIVNNRSNGFAGPLRVSISDPAGGMEIASSKQPTTGMWHRFEIPRDKLLSPSGGLRVDPAGAPDFKRAEIPSLDLSSPLQGKARHGTARIISPDGSATEGARLDAIDTSSLRLTDRAGKSSTMPRESVCWIELNDWQLAWLPPAAGAESPQARPGVTHPLRLRSFGLSGHNAIHFQESVSIESLIVPPWFLFGLDPNDSAGISDERRMGYDRHAMDQSPFHAEFVATLRIAGSAQVLMDFRNHYTNVEPGPLEVEIEHALTGRKIAGHKSTAWQLNRVEKFQSTRFLGK